MTNDNQPVERRVAEIQERWTYAYKVAIPPAEQVRADVDFLLSLVHQPPASERCGECGHEGQVVGGFCNADVYDGSDRCVRVCGCKCVVATTEASTCRWTQDRSGVEFAPTAATAGDATRDEIDSPLLAGLGHALSTITSPMHDKDVMPDVEAVWNEFWKLNALLTSTIAPGEGASGLAEALQWAIEFFRNIDSAGCSRKECERARKVAEIFSAHFPPTEPTQAGVEADLISRKAAIEIAQARLKDVPDTVDLEADRSLFAAGYLAAAGSIKAALERAAPAEAGEVERLSGLAESQRLSHQEDSSMTKDYDGFRAGMLRAAEMARNEFKRAPEAAKGDDCVWMGGYESACDHLSVVIAQAAVIDSVRIAGAQPDWQYHIALLLPDGGVDDQALLKIYQVVEHELRVAHSTTIQSCIDIVNRASVLPFNSVPYVSRPEVLERLEALKENIDNDNDIKQLN